MSYSENLATENERGALFMLGRLGLPTAAVALGCHASGYGDAFAWLATIIAAADMFSLALNYRARDEFFDRLFLAGARWALSTLAVWASVVAMLTLFLRDTGLEPVAFLSDQMTTLSAVMLAFFMGFNLAAWRNP
ncbi:hypothetical protein AAG614_03085 [Citromicrobium bathyomarinum]|tara:strand:- start:212 stop:616 length:405 start_codon:yes stop_codon:yes gene_type:complete